MKSTTETLKISPEQALIILGENMHNYILLKHLSENPMTLRDKKKANFILALVEALKQSAIDVNNIKLTPQKLEQTDLFELGKLTYQYYQNSVQFEAIADHLLKKLLPADNLTSLYVELGERIGPLLLAAQDSANYKKETSMKFWKSETTLNKEQQANFIKYEIRPLCLLILHAKENDYGLDRNAFNTYLEKHMPSEYRQQARAKKQNVADFFDSPTLPNQLKHELRDNFISETLNEKQQDAYFSGKILLNFYQNQLDLDKLLELQPPPASYSGER